MQPLTRREAEVLARLCVEPGPTIAEELGISEHTLRTHVGRILSKLGVHSRLEAVGVARSVPAELDALLRCGVTGAPA